MAVGEGSEGRDRARLDEHVGVRGGDERGRGGGDAGVDVRPEAPRLGIADDFRACGLAIAFVRREEEGALADDGAAKRSSELVELVFWLGLRGQKEWIARKQFVALIILEYRTMERVRTGAADHIHLPTDDAAVFGGEYAFDDLHFRHGFDAHDVDLILRAILAHRAPFRIGVRLSAVHRDTGPAGGDAVHPHRPPATGSIHSGRQRQHAGNVAARQRQFTHLCRSERSQLRR